MNFLKAYRTFLRYHNGLKKLESGSYLAQEREGFTKYSFVDQLMDCGLAIAYSGLYRDTALAGGEDILAQIEERTGLSTQISTRDVMDAFEEGLSKLVDEYVALLSAEVRHEPFKTRYVAKAVIGAQAIFSELDSMRECLNQVIENDEEDILGFAYGARPFNILDQIKSRYIQKTHAIMAQAQKNAIELITMGTSVDIGWWEPIMDQPGIVVSLHGEHFITQEALANCARDYGLSEDEIHAAFETVSSPTVFYPPTLGSQITGTARPQLTLVKP